LKSFSPYDPRTSWSLEPTALFTITLTFLSLLYNLQAMYGSKGSFFQERNILIVSIFNCIQVVFRKKCEGVNLKARNVPSTTMPL